MPIVSGRLEYRASDVHNFALSGYCGGACLEKEVPLRDLQDPDPTLLGIWLDLL